MKIIDCFNYFDEDLILEIRLATLFDYVDKFIICEATLDHAGNKKKLNLFRNLGIKTFKVSLNKKGKMDLKQALIKINSLGFSRVFVESGLTLSSEFLKE